MFGVLSQQPKVFLMSADDVSKNLGGGGNSMAITNTPAPPTQNFDLSVLSNLKPSDKYLGKNRVSDIQEAYQTYVTGNPIGRGGQYAVDSAKKYGVSIVEAARGYLQGVGLPILPQATTQTQTQTQTNETTKTDTTVVQQKNPFEILADILPNLFGNAVYNPPLQSQAYGYSPTTTEQPLTQSGSGTNIGLLIILAVVGVIAYFVYKRFVN
ncbi:MAG TPA: hypothetical protein VH815_03070 [Acidobacteriota bacterium]|jgi:hypothetical protein